jgi:hypothetical protein
MAMDPDTDDCLGRAGRFGDFVRAARRWPGMRVSTDSHLRRGGVSLYRSTGDGSRHLGIDDESGRIYLTVISGRGLDMRTERVEWVDGLEPEWFQALWPSAR